MIDLRIFFGDAFLAQNSRIITQWRWSNPGPRLNIRKDVFS